MNNVQSPDNDVLLTILENGSIGYWDWDILSGKSFQSPALKRMFGYEEHEIDNTMDAVRKLVFSEDLSIVDENFNDHVKSHGAIPFSNEIRNLHKDGSTIWVLCKGKVIEWDDDGNPLRAVGCNIDITEQKLAQEALTRSEAILKSIYDTTPIGLGVVNGDTVVNINNAFCAMVGYTEQELIGRQTKFLFPDEKEFTRVSGELLTQLSASGKGMIETTHRRSDGSIIDIFLYVALIENSDFLSGLVFSILDITERKNMEREKKHLEDMLLHSQKLESIGRLAGGIAHDFNNMITAIMGNAEMLKEQFPPDGKAYSKLETIELAAESAANLTRQLLAFSRKQIIAPRILNFNATVEIIQKMLITLIGENISLHINSDPRLDTIMADPGQIEQIILNLTVNARDAMPSGGHLYIETKNVVLDEAYSRMHINIIPGSYVMLAVSDTGTGMSKDAIDHCFEPFFTTKGIGKGTGLGLATVYGNVKQIGGTIELYSELGHGTTFKLYFPAAEQHAEIEAVQSKPLATLLGTETILLAEDNVLVLKFSREILEKAGYNILVAETGEEALAIGQHYKSTISLLITDVILPGINGRITSEKISAQHQDMETLYTSGYTADVIGKQGIVEQGIDFISKPYTALQLLSKVRSILDRK